MSKRVRGLLDEARALEKKAAAFVHKDYPVGSTAAWYLGSARQEGLVVRHMNHGYIECQGSTGLVVIRPHELTRDDRDAAGKPAP